MRSAPSTARFHGQYSHRGAHCSTGRFRRSRVNTRGQWSKQGRYGRKPLLSLSYLTVAGSAPAPEGLRVDHTDNETDAEYLPSLEELLDRKKDGTEVKVKCQSSQQQMVAQVTGSINDPVVELATRAANRGAAACSTSNATKSSPSSHVNVVIESERDKTSAATGNNKGGPVIFRSAGVADRRTRSFTSELGSETDRDALSPPSQPEQFCRSNGEREGSQSDKARLKSPSAGVCRRHRRLRSARRDIAVVRSILAHAGLSQSETVIRGDCADNHAGDDSSGTGEDDTVNDDDQDYEDGTESERRERARYSRGFTN